MGSHITAITSFNNTRVTNVIQQSHLNNSIMKKLVLFTCVLLLGINVINAQIEVGVKFGINSTDLASGGISVLTDNQTDFDLFLQQANYGVHLGFYSRVKLLGIFLEPGLLLNSTGVTYRIDEFDEGGAFNIFKNERYNTLDIPLMAGFKFLIFRVYAGPVAHLHLNSTSDIIDFGGYEQRFRSATYGWQAGIGLDLFQFRFQLNYEGNFTAFGDHITFNGHPYSFSDAPSRVIASFGVKL
jgi:hypothetical protein